MRKYFISTMALAIVMLTATPVLPQVLQYLGPSAGSCQGAGGLECMNQTCKDTFPGSQVCTSEDIIRSGATGMPSAAQRLHPKIVGVVYDGTDVVAVDYSGLSAPPDELTCDGWASSGMSLTSISVRDNGFALVFCDNETTAACCKAQSSQKGK